MVNKRLSLIAALFIMAAAMEIVVVADGQQTRVYYFGHEYVKIWINPDRSIDLLYDRSLTLESGDKISYVEIGQPKGDYTIGEAFDQYQHQLTTSRADEEDDFKARVSLYTPLLAGQTINFSLTTNVARMISNDTLNPSNVGMQFIPAWDKLATIYDVQIMIVLPVNVTKDMVITTEVQYDGTSIDPETGNLAVYWHKQSLTPNEKFRIGVSFPAEFVQPEQPGGEGDFFQNYGPVLFGGGILVVIVSLVVVGARKKTYLTPKVAMETLGIKRGLTAVEASYLLDLEPTQIVTEILYSLLQKRAVWTESANPALKLRVMPEFKDKTGTNETPLRYYEIDFLNSVKRDGTLDEEKLAHTVMFLRDTVEQKLRGYNRRDTVDYYRKIVNQAWTQVEQAGTVELASKAYDEQLLWLLLDPNNRSRTETAFRDRLFEPSPLWFWYWYGYTHYSSHPSYKPNVDVPAQSAKPPAIPGAEFANNIATTLEKTSSNIVVNIEKFANAIIPTQPSNVSHEPAHHKAGCVCACAACACACACVSCACACAGGGVG